MNRSLIDACFAAGAERTWEAAGTGVRRKVLGYDDLLMMVCVEFEKGAVGHVHTHPHRQVTYIESGTFEVQIGEDKRELKCGDSFFVPSNTAHGVVALAKGCLVDVFTPARQDFVEPKE